MAQEEICRKGPWTENEDLQLVFYVNLFGDRRWDFIAKVSGLKRTGKSCRLRWVNYLNPGLKRSKMTLNEERLVLELHSKWGNRWSRIARKLPGRTDNEIKNYWRTHMRKEAQEKKKVTSPSSSLSNSSSSSSISHHVDYVRETKERSFYDTGGIKRVTVGEATEKGYSLDEIWNDVLSEDEGAIKPIYDGCGYVASNFYNPTLDFPIWDYCPDSLWMNEEEERKIFLPTSEQFTLPFSG